jgi:hypothetical protein
MPGALEIEPEGVGAMIKPVGDELLPQSGAYDCASDHA